MFTPEIVSSLRALFRKKMPELTGEGPFTMPGSPKMSTTHAHWDINIQGTSIKDLRFQGCLQNMIIGTLATQIRKIWCFWDFHGNNGTLCKMIYKRFDLNKLWQIIQIEIILEIDIWGLRKAEKSICEEYTVKREERWIRATEHLIIDNLTLGSILKSISSGFVFIGSKLHVLILY